jgi:hypothetical protein
MNEIELRLNVCYQNIPCVHVNEIVNKLGGSVREERLILWPNGFRINNGNCDRKIVKHRKYVYLKKTFFKCVTSLEYDQRRWPASWHRLFSVSACLEANAARVKNRYILAEREGERISVSCNSQELYNLQFEYESEIVDGKTNLHLFDCLYWQLKASVDRLCKEHEYKCFVMPISQQRQIELYTPTKRDKFIFKRGKFGKLSQLNSLDDCVCSFKIDGVYGVAQCYQVAAGMYKMCAHFEDMVEYCRPIFCSNIEYGSITFQVERVSSNCIFIIDILAIDDIQLELKPVDYYLDYMNNFHLDGLRVQRYYTLENLPPEPPTACDGLIVVHTKTNTTYRLKKENSYELQYCSDNEFCDFEGNLYKYCGGGDFIEGAIYETIIDERNVIRRVIRQRVDRHFPNSASRIRKV